MAQISQPRLGLSYRSVLFVTPGVRRPWVKLAGSYFPHISDWFSAGARRPPVRAGIGPSCTCGSVFEGASAGGIMVRVTGRGKASSQNSARPISSCENFL